MMMMMMMMLLLMMRKAPFYRRSKNAVVLIQTGRYPNILAQTNANFNFPILWFCFCCDWSLSARIERARLVFK